MTIIGKTIGKRAFIALAGIALCVALGSIKVWSGTVILFGPQQFTRTAGGPNQYTATFSVPASVGAGFQLQIQNGDGQGHNKVNSASITLNGVEVVSPADFSSKPGTITRTVDLTAQNTVQVLMSSATGTFFTLSFNGQNKDVTPPEITITAPAAAADINDSTPRIAVTYKDKSGGEAPASGVDTTTLQVLVDGVDRTSLFTKRSGDASADLPSSVALAEGNHTVAASIKDVAGNLAQTSSQFVVDLTPPQVQILQPVAGSFLPSPTPAIAVQFSDNVGLDLSTLRILLNGVDSTSLFSVTPTGATAALASALPNGANHLSVKISDLAGNKTTVTAVFNVDTTPPVISIDHPANASFTKAGPVPVKVTYQDDQALDLSTLQVFADGNPLTVSVGAGSATASLSGLADGSHTLSASIRDRAGNPASTASAFTVDTTAPNIRIIQPVSGVLLNTPTPAITVDYSDNDAIDTSTLHVLVNGVDITGSFTVQAGVATLAATQPLPDGVNAIKAHISDLAGNIGHASSNFTLDTIKPVASFQTPPAQIGSNAPLVTFIYSDSGSGIDPASVHISLDGGDVTAAFAIGPTSSKATLQPNPPLLDGPHQLQGAVSDRAGNQTIVTATFFIDTTAPAATFVSPADNSFTNKVTPAVKLTYSDGNGTGVDPASIHIFLQQGTNPPAEITASFQIGPQEADGSISSGSPLTDGTYVLSAVVKDLVGNTATPTATFAVDTVLPTYRIESPADSSFVNTGTPTIVIDYQDDSSGVDPSRLVVTVDGVDRTNRFTTTATQATGTLQLSDTLPDGQHQVAVQVFDRAGNEAPVVPQRFTVDTTPPTITPLFAPPANAAGWNNSAVTITFTCADSGSGVATCQSPITVSADGIQTIIATATDAAGNTATLPVLVRIALVPPTITGSVAPAPNAAGWNNTSPVTVTFVCTPGSAPIATCAAPQTVSSEGVQQVSGTAVDVAGFTATASVTVQLDVTPPTISAVVSPQPDGTATITAPVATVTFTCSDALSGVLTCPSAVTVSTSGPQTISGTAVDNAGNTATASATFNLQSFSPLAITASIVPPPNAAGWNNTQATVSFLCTGGVPPVTCPGPQSLSSDGANQVVSGTASDAAGNSAVTTATVNVDQTPPLVSITSPTSGGTVSAASVTVSGLASDGLSGIAAVSCNGTSASFSNGSFTCSLQVTQGSLPISVQVTDVAGNTASTSITTNLQGPALAITSPAALDLFNHNSITVTGTVDDPNALITVNGVQTANNGGTFSAQGVVLREGSNVVTASGTNAGGAVGTASVNVVVDTTPPIVVIDSPSDQAVVTSSQIYVTGMVNDVVPGTVNLAQATVIVNGVKADVTNRSFMAEDVLLVPGNNVITAVATDKAGNTSQTQITVTLLDASNQQKILMVSGNGQAGLVGSTLPQPLAVEVVNAVGQPMPAVPITFTLVKGDGQLTAFPQQARAITVQTDGNGQASANLQLGTRVGSGNNQVLVTSPGFVGQVMFCSTATVGAATQIHDIAGEGQKGVVGQALAQPFTVVVFDAGGNPVAGSPVVFKVEQGGGMIESGPTVTKTTDSDGRASATLTLAQEEGINNNVVSATLGTLTSATVAFSASGVTPGNATNTTVSGIVLDNANSPLVNVTASIQGTNLSALTNQSGRFVIANAPVGSIELFIDGSTSSDEESYPFLEFPMVTVAGQDNHLPSPIFLPELDLDNSKIVGGDEDVTLTMKGVPGVLFTVLAHSATFPDGTHVGRMSVSQVHSDKVPMPPPNATAPHLFWTVQPPRVKFNPPMRIQIPNTEGIAPGTVTEIFCYNHDLEEFASGGTARVSNDGSVIVSDPGSGVIVSGWGDAPPPPPPPSCADGCGKCGTCENGECVMDPPLDTTGTTVTIQFGFPNEAAKQINDALEKLSAIGVIASVNLLQISGSITTKECCEAETGRGHNQSGNVTGNFGGFSVEYKIWPPGPIPTFNGTVDIFGVASLTAKAQFIGGVFLGVAGKVTGQVGYKQNDCSKDPNDRAGCFFAQGSIPLTFSATAKIGGTASLSFDCIFCTKTTIEGEGTLILGGFSWAVNISDVSYNVASCSAGVTGGLFQPQDGEFKISAEFKGSYSTEGGVKRTYSASLDFLSCKINLSGVTCE